MSTVTQISMTGTIVHEGVAYKIADSMVSLHNTTTEKRTHNGIVRIEVKSITMETTPNWTIPNRIYIHVMGLVSTCPGW